MVGDLTAVLEDHVPYDGPHTAEKLEHAAAGMAVLARYLANATRTAGVVSYASDLPVLLFDIAVAAQRLPQVFDQLAGHLGRMQARGVLADDSAPHDPAVAAGTVRLARDCLGAAGEAAVLLGEWLDATQRETARLATNRGEL